MAAATREIGFYTNVYVLPARNPVQVAKIMATASVFTGGRVALGVGMGWMPEEFAISGQASHDRGRRADEMIDIMKSLWTGAWVEHRGEGYDFYAVGMVPAPAAPIPILVGGIAAPALPRAARNDGGRPDWRSTA